MQSLGTVQLVMILPTSNSPTRSSLELSDELRSWHEHERRRWKLEVVIGNFKRIKSSALVPKQWQASLFDLQRKLVSLLNHNFSNVIESSLIINNAKAAVPLSKQIEEMLLSPHGAGNSFVSGLGSDTSVTGSSSSSSYRCGKVGKHLSKRKTIEWNQKLKAFEMLRAASEMSRSSYYSLHMEVLRWESNITFWSSGNQDAVNKEEKIGAVLNLEGALSLLEQKK
ncbi:hypothetical protein Bca101_010773 [Brassica carinata]